MHSKTKGNVGELYVAADLAAQGYAVFSELGDSSRIDLIAIKDSKLIRIQVKTQGDTSAGTIGVPVRSSGPGYSYNYTSDDIDIIAVFALDRQKTYYIPINKCEQYSKGMTLRIDESKNGQSKGIHLAEDYRFLP